MKSPEPRRASAHTTSPAREELLRAAEELLASRRPDDITSRLLADTASVNLGAVAYYFDSKDRLLAEAMVGVARRLISPVVSELTDTDREPVAVLLSGIQRLYATLEENRERLPAYLHALAAAGTDPAIAADVNQLRREVTAALADSINGQLDQGQLPNWVRAEPMADLIVAVVHGVVVTAATDPGHSDESAVASQFAQLLLNIRAVPPSRGQ